MEVPPEIKEAQQRYLEAHWRRENIKNNFKEQKAVLDEQLKILSEPLIDYIANSDSKSIRITPETHHNAPLGRIRLVQRHQKVTLKKNNFIQGIETYIQASPLRGTLSDGSYLSDDVMKHYMLQFIEFMYANQEVKTYPPAIERVYTKSNKRKSEDIMGLPEL